MTTAYVGIHTVMTTTYAEIHTVMTTTYAGIHTVMIIGIYFCRDTHSVDNYAALYRKPIKQVPFYSIRILLLTTMPVFPGQY